MLGLTVQDNGDGSTATATVTGSDAGSSNHLFVAAYGGLQTGLAGALAWTAAGTRTGDGTLTATAGPGLWFWYVAGTVAAAPALTAPLFQGIADPAKAIHYRCLTAIQQRIQGLALPGLTSAAVVVSWVPRSWERLDPLPAVYVSPVGQDGEVGVLTGSDDVRKPCLVVIADRNNQNYAVDEVKLRWRERILRAVRHQRLVGMPEVRTVDVSAQDVVLPEVLRSRNLVVSPILFQAVSRETRG